MMTMSNAPLRYHISDLRQLNQCQSNNSQQLHIVTTTFLNDDRLNGLRVQVIHDTFGVLYACTFNAKGTLISPYDIFAETTIAQLLFELKKYGFIVFYDPVKNLPGAQLDFLATLTKLGYDRLRVLPICKKVRGNNEFYWKVVLFKADDNPLWLDARYYASQKEYDKALEQGTAFNVSGISEAKKFHWEWLYGFVADIDDILKDNTGTLERK